MGNICVNDLIKPIFSSTVKCIGKCGGEWVIKNAIYVISLNLCKIAIIDNYIK